MRRWQEPFRAPGRQQPKQAWRPGTTPSGSSVTAGPDQYLVLVTCRDEKEQVELFHRVFLSYTEHYAIFNPNCP